MMILLSLLILKLTGIQLPLSFFSRMAFFLFFWFVMPVGFSQDLYLINRKTIDKELATEGITNKLSEKPIVCDKSITIYILQSNNEPSRWLAVAEGKGRHEKFDFMAVFTADLQVKHMKVLNYRSPYGSEITHKNWLSQFSKIKPTQDFIYQKNIDGISGASLSASSVTEQMNCIRNELKRLTDLTNK